MPIGWDDALAVGGSLLGGLFGNSSAKKAAKRQMAFQERMRDTQYQAATKDMIAAGLNPMLAVSQGGAASPSGALAQTPMNIGEQSVNSALAAKLQRAQIDNIEADTNTKNMIASKTEVEKQLLEGDKIKRDVTGSPMGAGVGASIAGASAKAYDAVKNAVDTLKTDPAVADRFMFVLRSLAGEYSDNSSSAKSAQRSVKPKKKTNRREEGWDYFRGGM